MAGAELEIVRRIGALFRSGAAGARGDGALLERFRSRADEAAAASAFEALVERHGPMVLRVCRGVLRDEHDAEDAAQATFLVLARKAGAIRRGDSVASWLFGVALRVARRARAGRERRRRAIERRGAEMSTRPAVGNANDPETWSDLYEELDRLPERLRGPVVLCHLEGLTHEQAAAQLRCPLRTLQRRLADARARLRTRLVRRGLGPAVVLTILTATATAKAEAVPAAWAESTVRAALRVAGGRSLAGIVATTVIELWRETLKGMLMSKLKLVAAGLALAALAAAGAGRFLLARETASPPGSPLNAARADDPKKAAGGAALIDDKTDAAIRKGLDWLEVQQHEDGSFGPDKLEVAVTSLAGMALLGSGAEPGRGDRGARIDRATKYLLDHARDDGFFGGSVHQNAPMYGHGFAALFLAECYARARRPELRTAIEKSVALLADTQNAEGGWRYEPKKADADLSVTACQINALRAARRAGIAVPEKVMAAALSYADSLQNPDGGFRYMRQGGASGFPRSAAGVLSLTTASDTAKVDARAKGPYADEIARGFAFLNAHGLDGRDPHFFYAQYYATQAFRLRGGDDWTHWYESNRDLLLSRQADDGRWRDGFSDEYGTAMALIVLQAPRGHVLDARAEVKAGGPGPAVAQGILRGRVVYRGKVVEPRVLVDPGVGRVKDAEVMARREPFRSERLLVDPETRGVKNAIVFLDESVEVRDDARKAAPKSVRFRADRGVFTPHVLAAMAGTEILIETEDPINYVVDVRIPGAEFAVNLIDPAAEGPDTRAVRDRLIYVFHGDVHRKRAISLKVVPRAGFPSPMPVRDVLHFWLSAWWLILDHPYFAVTDARGRFEIRGIPPGPHRVAVWHEAIDPRPAGSGAPAPSYVFRGPIDFESGRVTDKEFEIDPGALVAE